MTASVAKLKSNRTPGPDNILLNNTRVGAVEELHSLLADLFASETIPEDFVLADMLMMYKKKCRDTRGNYRALGLLNHAYKIFTSIS